MPIPFDMLVVMLFLGYYTESPVANPPPLLHSLGVVGASVLLMLASAAMINLLGLRALRRPGRTMASRRHLTGIMDLGLRCILVGLFVVGLYDSSFPWSAAVAMGLSIRSESVAVQLMGLIPYVLLFFAAWLPVYRLHRETTPGVWTRGSFIVYKARYNLYMLLAWVPFALLTDWLGEFLLLLPLLFLAAAWTFPFLLARAWGCKRLPEGEVMDTVRRLEKEAGASFSRVYLWEPGGGGIQNAAAVGIFRPFRYLFLTPALVRGMQGPELEAVILHELGHVRKRHLLFYLFTSLAGINIAVLFGALIPMAGSVERFLLTAVLVFSYFRLVFGWLSRNMERQADLFALEKIGSARGLANALEKLGLSAGNIRLANSWHHLGIAERVDYLRRAERAPEMAREHNRAVSRMMAAGYLLSFLMLGAMVWLIHMEYSGGLQSWTRTQAAADADVAVHWRRVMRLMPDDARSLLELAYRLAGDPERRGEAAALAERAGKLAGAGEVRDAAEKLLRELKDEGTDW